MNKNVVKAITIALVSLALLVGTTAIVRAEVGVTDTTIKVGSIQPLSGPPALAAQNTVLALKLYFQYINDEGGIHGRKIKLLFEDDGYSPPRTVAAAKKLILRDEIFCFVANMGSPTVPTIFPILQEKKIPLYGTLGAARVFYDPPKRYVFSIFLPYDVMSRLIVDFIVKDLNDKNPKIAFIGPDDEMGKTALKGAEEGMGVYGLKLVAKDWYKRTAVDFLSQVLNVYRARPDYVIITSIVRETLGILSEARKLNWRPQFFSYYVALGDGVVKLAGDDARRLMSIADKALIDSDVPGMVKYRSLVKKYQSDEKIDYAYHLQAYFTALVFVEGLKRAGKDLTRERLVDALETLKNFETGGITAPLTYTPEQRCPFKSGYFLKADPIKGKWVKISDWREPTPLK